MDGAPPDSRTSFPQRDERRMQLSVSGKHLDVGDSLRGHVTSAVAESAERYFGDAIEGKVTFQRDRRHAYRADISLHVARRIMVQSHGEAADPYVAFDAAPLRLDRRPPPPTHPDPQSTPLNS